MTDVLREIRPDRDALRRILLAPTILAAIAGGMLALVGVLFALLPSTRWIAVVFVVVGVAVAAFAILWWSLVRTRMRFEYGGGRYAWIGPIGLRREFGADAVRRGALTPLLRAGFGRPFPALCLAGPPGVRRILSGGLVPSSELPLLADDLRSHGVDVPEYLPDATAVALRAIDPGLVPWRFAHPGAWMAIVLGSVLVALPIVVIVVIFVAWLVLGAR